ncbi:MAG TPA: hypothetical protein VFF68_00225 [Anaerolineaceae bacterium]|nr:hypothetical protein [Anaerolineaceae bacterium]
MREATQNDIRKLLKTFGVRTDQAIAAYLEQHPSVRQLRLRLVLEDLTDYGGNPPAEPLAVVVEGEVNQAED